MDGWVGPRDPVPSPPSLGEGVPWTLWVPWTLLTLIVAFCVVAVVADGDGEVIDNFCFVLGRSVGGFLRLARRIVDAP